MKLGTRELIVLALLLSFLGGAWWLGFRPLASERAFYREDVERKRATLSTLQQHAAGVDELEQQLAAVKDAIELFERRLPRQKEVDVILGDVWELGSKHDLRPKTVKPLKSERAGACSEQPIELTFEGEFPGILAFLAALERSDRIVRVTQLECMRNQNDYEKPLQAKLTLNIYFEPDASPMASVR